MDLKIKKYNSEYKSQWNDFVQQAKNATFLFDRNFMDYHKDRFSDFSLMVFDKQQLRALFPANISNNKVYSHQGLTYGGIVIDNSVRLSDFIAIFDVIINYLTENQIDKVFFKTLPHIYSSHFSDELLYALFLKKAQLYRRDTLTVIDYTAPQLKYNQLRKRGIKKAEKLGILIKEGDFDVFWEQLLVPKLNQKYKTNPVHSLDEIKFLANNFPNNIRQYVAYYHDIPVAGATIFETETVAHVQYIAAGEAKDETGALDYLFDYLINRYKNTKKYFDFGISNEQDGHILNYGLSFWKESFGAKIVVHDFYELGLNRI
ncbi:MAG: GNAT family N-acetyltransferase [Bacteroidota bacterium]|nr:GNAT family N-acetyltransferase [Bacteroidota bacterium]